MKPANSAARICAVFGLILGLLSMNAFAQATRTWVSGVGDDANPCSRTAPCKTFAGAISKTAAGGEINVLDPGGFGAVTITKSITIDGAGAMASILASGTNGVIVNAGAGGIVTLRNLSINAGTPAFPGLNGIRVVSVGTLHVEGVTVFGFAQEGLEFAPNTNAELFVKDSSFNQNLGAGSGGMLIKPTAPATSVLATLDGVQMNNNQFGLRAETGANVAVRNCVTSGNTNNGFLMIATGTTSKLMIDNCTISSNGSIAGSGGIKAEGAAAVIRIGNSLISDNTAGLVTASGGQIISFGNNLLAGNITDGNPSSTIPTR